MLQELPVHREQQEHPEHQELLEPQEFLEQSELQEHQAHRDRWEQPVRQVRHQQFLAQQGRLVRRGQLA